MMTITITQTTTNIPNATFPPVLIPTEGWTKSVVVEGIVVVEKCVAELCVTELYETLDDSYDEELLLCTLVEITFVELSNVETDILDTVSFIDVLSPTDDGYSSL